MFVADLHNDVLQRAIIGEDIINKSNNGHSDIIRLIDGNINLEVFVIWVTKKYININPFNRANKLIDKLEEIEKNCNHLKIIKSLNDLNIAKKKSLLAAPFGIEGGECIQDNLEHLMHFIKRGILYFGPTWNHSNLLATSAYDEKYNSKKINYLGLKKFGEDVVKLCDENSVLIDISHIGEKSFWDIIKISNNPIIASHSCVYNLCPHYRNLKDDQINEIKRKNGAIFVNLYPNFFDPDFKKKERILKNHLKKELEKIKLKYNDRDELWIHQQNFLQKNLRIIAPDLKKYVPSRLNHARPQKGSFGSEDEAQ